MQERVEKKKLLITASTFPRYETDTEPRFILDLAKELQKYFEVTVLVPASSDAAASERLEGINVERYRYFPIHRMETLCYPGAIIPRIREKKVRGLLVPFLIIGLYIALLKRRKKYDYVHANWLIPQGVVQSFFKIPYILTGHGGDVASMNKGIVKYLKRRAVRNAKTVTVVSSALKEELLEIFPQKERESILKKLLVQPMGCDVARFGSIHRKENLWGQNGKSVVLFVGRLAEKKGVRYLIDAVQQLDVLLVIVGDGPLMGKLKEQTRELGMENKVLFMGAKTHEQLPEIYASADVFAAPSVTAGDKDKEGFGLVILEAMASGLPVVASRSGGITEIIRHGWNGLLTEEKDSLGLAENISMALTDSILYNRIAANMKYTVESYNYAKVGARYAEIILDGYE